MPIGNLLQGREQQYVAKQDDKGTWRVLDTWHESLKNLQSDDDVEDDNPAITILSFMFLAICMPSSINDKDFSNCVNSE